MENGKNKFLTGILLLAAGGAVGAIAALLNAPKSGKELRSDIKRDIDTSFNKAKAAGEKLIQNAKVTADEVLVKADQIMSLTKNYASGNYEGPFEKLKGEINGLKSGINAAMRRYRDHELTKKSASEIFNQDLRDLETMMEFSNNEDDSLPKYEGMRRRN
ncbi:MAG: YtxH domain-containing protein [Ignavibacteriaceae bacterium]|nr:YtxH domain-containing protein [Ignavibacteriaceae bacterium]